MSFTHKNACFNTGLWKTIISFHTPDFLEIFKNTL